MSQKKMKKYASKLKAKIVIEALKNDRTIAEIASEYNTHPKNIQNWRKHFLEHVECVFNQDNLLNEYKEKIRTKDDEVEQLYRTVGKLTAQLDWAKKKSEELGFDV
jgi:transposase-like protein